MVRVLYVVPLSLYIYCVMGQQTSNTTIGWANPDDLTNLGDRRISPTPRASRSTQCGERALIGWNKKVQSRDSCNPLSDFIGHAHSLVETSRQSSWQAPCLCDPPRMKYDHWNPLQQLDMPALFGTSQSSYHLNKGFPIRPLSRHARALSRPPPQSPPQPLSIHVRPL